MKHPLLNENSKHYEQNDKVAIEELEKKLTVKEMIGFCKGSIFKYDFRKDFKGQREDDMKKRKTYIKYLALLSSISSVENDSMYVIDVFKKERINLQYQNNGEPDETNRC